MANLTALIQASSSHLLQIISTELSQLLQLVIPVDGAPSLFRILSTALPPMASGHAGDAC